MKVLLQKYYPWMPMLLLCLYAMARTIHFPIHDFENYYFGGYFLWHDQFVSELYFPYIFNTKITTLGYPPVFAGFAPNTPFLALLLVPFSFLSLAVAKFLFNSISILLFVYTLRRLVMFYKINALYVLLLPVLFLVPIKNDLLFGQVYLLLFFFLSESWLAYEKNQSWKVAILLSLAILLKVFPLLLVVVFLFKKQFRPFLYTLLSCLILVLMTVVCCGFEVWVFYIQSVLSKAFNGGIASAYVVNYQSVFMFLKTMFVYDSTQNPNAFFHFPVLFGALLLTFKISLLAIGFYITKKITDSLFIFSYWILAIILISPYGSSYTFILLLFPFFALAKSELSKSQKVLFLVLLFLINNLLLSFFMDAAFPFSYLRLYVLLAFFIGWVAWKFRSVNWKIVSSAAAITMLGMIIFSKNEPESSSYLLPNESPLLIHDYTIANHRLTYFYWNEKGENTASIPFNTSAATALELKENQVYYNDKPLTFDNSNKRKPMLINNNCIVYLSDSDRGIGFYTLRKIEIH